MERLEAALEKARERRQSVQASQADPAEVQERPKTTRAPERWHNLKEIKLTARTARANRITTQKVGKSSGPYDLLRSRTIRAAKENNWRTIAVTSPNKACGKSTVVINLGISLARQTDLKVMILDLDLRRPALHKIVGHRPTHNFHEVLEGKVRAEDQLLRMGDNLAIGLNNAPARNPSELLQSNLTKTRLEQLVNVYEPDLVLIDLPPMLVSDDNVAFLPSVDCGILVNASESTTVSQLDSCEKELAELTSVLGVVLNKCRYDDDDFAYDYDY